MKITKLRVNKEFTPEENKLLELLYGPVNYTDILKYYSKSIDTIFYYINSLHKKFIVQKGKRMQTIFYIFPC